MKPTQRFRPRSPGGLLLLGLGLLVLLGFVAAVSRAHHTPGGHAGVHSPPSGVGDWDVGVQGERIARFVDIEVVARRKAGMIHFARALSDLLTPPGNRLEL